MIENEFLEALDARANAKDVDTILTETEDALASSSSYPDTTRNGFRTAIFILLMIAAKVKGARLSLKHVITLCGSLIRTIACFRQDMRSSSKRTETIIIEDETKTPENESSNPKS